MQTEVMETTSGFTEKRARVNGVGSNYKITGKGPVVVFHGEVPLAWVKHRKRTYFEHFWNDFAAVPNRIGIVGGLVLAAVLANMRSERRHA